MNEPATDNHQHHKLHINKRWKARIVVCTAMLILAFFGLVIMDIHPNGFLVYSQVLTFLYASLSLWLFWFLNRSGHKIQGSTIWHQLLHWFALFAAVYVVDIFVDTGVIGSTQAGLVILILLALTIFIAGIYSNPSFMFIGITLGVFAVAAAYIQAYLSVIMIPVALLAGLIIYIILHKEKKKAEKTHE